MAQLVLRPHQNSILDKLREGFAAGHRSQMLYGPCGSGKTEIAVSMMDAAQKKGRRNAMLVDLKLLCAQTSERLCKYEIDHGIIQPESPRWRPELPIQVCMVQTLEAREGFPSVDLLIVDEAHTLRQSVIDFVRSHPMIKVVGLSGSPFTKGLGNTYSNVVSATTINELVAENLLINPRIFIATKSIDMTGAKKVAGEWSDKEATERGIKITGDIVTEWITKTNEVFGGPKKTIVFCAGVAHGNDLALKFSEAGYNFISVSYRDTDEYKAQVLEDFAKPDTEIHGLIATDLLSKGFDVTDVCIKEGQRVLTDYGLVPIDKITLQHKIWDGIEFVTHEGAICKGIKHVIQYAGLTATPDHLVKTSSEGWRSLGYCADKQIPIITTGFGGTAISISENYFTGIDKNATKNQMAERDIRGLSMRRLWERIPHDVAGVKQQVMEWVRQLPRFEALTRMALASYKINALKVYKSRAQSLFGLWWTRDQICFPVNKNCSAVDCRQPWNTREEPRNTTGSNRQQRELRTGKSSLVKSLVQWIAYKGAKHKSEISPIPGKVPTHQVCRQNPEKLAGSWLHSRGDSGKVQQTIGQTEGRVWDILNCGPRNSFTCEGLLVHNCVGISARPFSKSFSAHVQQLGRIMRPHESKDQAIWLDHAGNYLRFQDQWDELCSDGVKVLDDGAEKAKPEPTDKEKEAAKCPKCGHLWNVATDVCPHCGFVRARKNDVVEVAGLMTELNLLPKKEKYSPEYKESFYAQLLGWTVEKNKKPGMAYYKYIEKFGVGPSMAKPAPIAPGPEVNNWIRSRNIVWAKSQRRAA